MTNRVGRSAVSVEFVGHLFDSFQDVVSQAIQLFRIHYSFWIDKAPACCGHHRSTDCVHHQSRRKIWCNQNSVSDSSSQSCDFIM